MPFKPNWYSDSLVRGVTVIKAFDRQTPRMRISDVATKTKLTRAAVRRYLLTLRELGYVSSDGDWFHLMPHVLELGYSFISSMRLEEFVEPILKDLCSETECATHFAVLDNNETLFLGSAASPRMYGFYISVGGRQPAYAGSLGKALLSGLSEERFNAYLTAVSPVAHTRMTLTRPAAIRREVKEVRTRGYAVNRGEYNAVIVGVAVPVRSKDSAVAAAINVNWTSAQPPKDAEIRRYLKPLKVAAQKIETRFTSGAVALGWSPR